MKRLAYTILAAAVTWGALGLQFYLTMARTISRGRPWFGGVSTYFSFFTILTNALVALSLTWPLVIATSRGARFLSRPEVRAAVLAYIVTVGIAYNLLLRHLWAPQGWDWVADELLHDGVPVLYALYWLAFVPKGRLRFGHLPSWFLYPVVYVAYALLRGAASGRYPYPFLDAGKLGHARVLVNALGLLSGFFVLSLGLLGMDSVLGRASPKEKQEST